MTVALFIPCYIDQFYPQVGRATLHLLESLGCQVSYPPDQTCCGQPMANSGGEAYSKGVYRHFVSTFSDYDYIVTPSGSCTYHVRTHYDIIEQTAAVQHIRARTLDLTEFLLDVLQVTELPARFPHKVGVHPSCHGLRGLRLAPDSERVISGISKVYQLLSLVDGIELIEAERPDECCGFGGTFAVHAPELSVKMGKDRIADFMRQGAEVITAGDMSCLMHLEGIIRRRKLPIRVMHLVGILYS